MTTPPEPTPQPTPQPGDMSLAAEVVGWALNDDTPLIVRVAQAIARARHAGEVAGALRMQEMCARLCDSYVGDSDGSTWQDAAMVTRDKCAAAIRSLAPSEVKP